MARVSVIVLLLVLMLSCNRLRPAVFWSNYRKQLIKESKWDLGPWGGFVAMHWRAPQDSTFSVKNITHFADKNGWQRIDSISMTREAVGQWMNFSDPVFPFAYTDFSDHKSLDFRFPRWIDSDIVIYRFKTGWIAVQPGNARETDINGYVVISADKLQFSVYHLWGE